MLTERTIATLVTLFKSYLLWSNSATGWWWELGPDQDVPQVLGVGEGSHGGQWHILSSIIITVKQALVAMADEASYIR